MEAGRPSEEREKLCSCFITKAECLTAEPSQAGEATTYPRWKTSDILGSTEPPDTRGWGVGWDGRGSLAWEWRIFLSAGTARAASIVGSEGLTGRAGT